MTEGLVSIITPAYNCDSLIEETIDSVQKQSYENWEMIIVDDGSSDGTAKIVHRAAAEDSRIKFFQQTNSGPAVARNTGLEKADGQYIAFLDSDDLWLPHKLKTQIDFLKENDAAFCFSQYRRFTSNSNDSGKIIKVPEKINYETLLEQNVIGTLTTLIDISKTGPLKMIDEGYDDYILWLDIVKRVGVAYGLQADLARYRIVGGSVSRNKIRAAKWIWHIYRRVENLSLLKSLYYLSRYTLRVSKKHQSL